MNLVRPLFFFFIAVSSFRAFAPAPGSFLGDLSWPEAEARLKEMPLVVLPFGAGAKEHGPHLPMNADAKVPALGLAWDVLETPAILTRQFLQALQGFSQARLQSEAQ